MLPILFPWWKEYPNVNDEILNLDWTLYTVKHLAEEVANFINLNTIKYADPILWDITNQYEANTVVVDPQTGDAFISTKPVPYGVSLANTDYWTKIYNYAAVISGLEEQIAAANEGLSTTATASRAIGDLVWLNGLLYKVTSPMIAGDTYVVNSNCEKTTIEEELKLIISTFEAEIGDLASLNTTDKSNLVAAINEVLGLCGNLASLNTTDKSNLVAAINETYLEAINKHLTDIVDLKEDFGAVGDGVTDDTTAVQNFINACLNGKVGYIPEGVYICSSQIVIDYSTANTRQLKIFGAGCYRSTLKSTMSSGVSFFFTSNMLFDSFHTVINDIGFVSSTTGICLQIGKDDFSDAMGNYNFTNVFVCNTSGAASSVGGRLNYLFDCLFNNCIWLCAANGNGDALQIRLARFCTFIGGSYSNAEKGIHFTGNPDTLTFIGSDFENLDYGVYIDSGTTGQYIKFITCYFDIWRPDLTPPTYGKNAVYSELANFASVGLFIFDNCLFARAGIYGSGGIDVAHIFGCKFIGNYSYPAPAQPTSGAGFADYLNTSGMDLIAYMWTINTDATSRITAINVVDDTFNGVNTNIQCGQDGITQSTIRVPVGSKLEVYYTGDIYWSFKPLNT